MYDGAEVGSQTQVVLFPAAGVNAVVLTNTSTDGNDDLAAQSLMKEVLSKAPAFNPSSDDQSPAPSYVLHLLLLVIEAILLVIALVAD